MGFDCTLHLIDERAIREEFIPKLLQRSRRKTALDRVMQNAVQLWNTTRQALERDEPAAAASLACQLAITFSACSLAHHYERGFALCLWQDHGKDTAVEYPAKFAYSPEPLFADVVKEYPKLHGRFPTWFNGNYSTGVFIPSQRVREVLAWVERRIAPMAKGDQRHFKGLLRILRTAAQQGLAYWEATDLAVPMASEFPGDPNLMTARYVGNEPTAPAQDVEQSPLVGNFSSLGSSVLDGWLISGDYRPFGTNFWDLSTWPPRLTHTLAEFAPAVSRSRSGSWLLFSETNPEAKPRTFRPRLFSDLGKKPVGTFPVLVGGKELSVRAGGFVRDRPLVFQSPPPSAKVGDRLPPPLWLDGRSWKATPGIPDVAARKSALPHSVAHPVVGVVYLGDGGDVVVWEGGGYELRGKRFEKTFAMEAKESCYDWTYAAAGTDGFFYLSNRRLFEIHRHGKATQHARRWTNIMSILPGPAGGILLKEGENKDGDVAKLYFPADRTFIHIEPELFDDKNYPFIYWSRAVDRCIVLSGKFLAIPTAAVLSLPRHHAATGSPVKG